MTSVTESIALNSCVHCISPLHDIVDPNSPSLIVVFGWFHAKLPHVKKYVSEFRKLYPSATAVIIEVGMAWAFHSQTTREELLKPVADIIENVIKDEGSGFGGIFLHVMSNGGGFQLMTLSKLLAKRKNCHESRYPVALLLDSAPESSSFRCCIAALTAGIRNPLLKLVATPAFALLYSGFHLSYGPTGVIPELRQRLKSPNLIPFQPNFTPDQDGRSFEPAAALARDDIEWIPRLYMCSKTDQVSRISAILSHVEECRKAGFDVRTEIFDDTPHVSHAIREPRRYWDAVQQLWIDARRRSEQARL
ncbi:hypothetical protein BDW22DRAFT_1242162 [Trametopsis cervina]|nr:hypothetical protein BDW22DRAFT_1242162 [Trametopsis cervina]